DGPRPIAARKPTPEEPEAEADPAAEPEPELPAPVTAEAPPAPQPPASARPDAQILPFPKAPPAPAAEPEEKPAPPPARRKGEGALTPGLAKTRAGWIARLGQIFSGRKEIDPTLVDEIEKVLLTADIGVRTSAKLLEELRASLSRKELASADAVW